MQLLVLAQHEVELALEAWIEAGRLSHSEQVAALSCASGNCYHNAGGALVGGIVAPPAPSGLVSGPAPSFSVVIAAYEAAGTIAEAVESALSQSVPPIEVLVVDDGSSDGLERVLDPYRDRIIYLPQPHRGPSATRNAGARRASGDFIAILDADDVYEPGRLQALGALAAARPDLDILTTDAYFEAGGVVTGRFSQKTPFAVGDQSTAILERCFIAEPAVRREALLAAGGYDETLRIAEDWDLWIRMLHAGSVAGMVDEPLLRYRIGGPSLTSRRAASLRSRVRVLELASRLDLNPAQRSQLKQSRRSCERRARLAEAEEALRSGSDRARLRSLMVAVTREMPMASRAWGLASAVAPRVAARRLTQRERARRGARLGSRRVR
jgi:hypothetical protein